MIISREGLDFILKRYGVDLHDWLTNPLLPNYHLAETAMDIAKLWVRGEQEGWTREEIKGYAVSLDLAMRSFLPR